MNIPYNTLWPTKKDVPIKLDRGSLDSGAIGVATVVEFSHIWVSIRDSWSIKGKKKIRENRTRKSNKAILWPMVDGGGRQRGWMTVDNPKTVSNTTQRKNNNHNFATRSGRSTRWSTTENDRRGKDQRQRCTMAAASKVAAMAEDKNSRVSKSKIIFCQTLNKYNSLYIPLRKKSSLK